MISLLLLAMIHPQVKTVPASAAVSSSHAAACHAVLSASDARVLATQTPNARAFVDNQGAKLKTEIAGYNEDGSVRVRVMDSAHQDELVGVYTVNLHTGNVLDDDQEPAEDHATEEMRQKLQARHCGSHESAEVQTEKPALVHAGTPHPTSR